MSLEEAPKGYDMSKKTEDGCIKIVLKPDVNGTSNGNGNSASIH